MVLHKMSKHWEQSDRLLLIVKLRFVSSMTRLIFTILIPKLKTILYSLFYFQTNKKYQVILKIYILKNRVFEYLKLYFIFLEKCIELYLSQCYIQSKIRKLDNVEIIYENK